jgi:predicted nuclease with TOPRIM domain
MAEDDEDFDYEFDDDEEEEVKKPEADQEEKKGNEEEDDDQKSQKVNGQLEALQESLRKMEEENAKLNKAIVTRDEEIEELKAHQEEAKDSAEPSFTNLMDIFVSFAQTNGISCSATSGSGVTEDMAMSILSEAQAKLQQKPPTRPTTTSANCDESELVQRVQNLEEELRLALGAAEDIRALKAKAIQLVERIRLEKEDRLKAEAEVRTFVKKVEMLSDHIEKLMIHLKHEAAAKIKAVDQLRGSEKRNEILKEDFELLSRKAAAKERLIAELREGSKILEDQLRLMDEKYLELRTKLDYAREVAGKKVRKAQQVASDLRVKFALAGNQKLLDHIPLPDIQDNSYDMSFENSQSMLSFESSQSMPTLDSQRGPKKKNKKPKKKNNSHVSQDAEQSTERVLDKIRRLRGGEQDWNETKCRNLATTR